MNKAMAKEIDESLEAGIGKAIHALERPGAAFHHLKNADGEMSGNPGTLLGLMTERSTREIDNLIDELQGLRKKLTTDCDRIQSEIARYSELSEGAMQLTSIISDNVKKLPNSTH